MNYINHTFTCWLHFTSIKYLSAFIWPKSINYSLPRNPIKNVNDQRYTYLVWMKFQLVEIDILRETQYPKTIYGCCHWYCTTNSVPIKENKRDLKNSAPVYLVTMPYAKDTITSLDEWWFSQLSRRWMRAWRKI